MEKGRVCGVWLKSCLLELGWSQAKFARLLRVRSATVSDWVNGSAPGYAGAYLELALAVHGLGSFFDE